MSVSVYSVLLYASLTAVATGLGALPLIASRSFSPRWIGFSNAFAAGLMLAASILLVYEGAVLSAWRMPAGVVAGVAFLMWSRRILDGHDHAELGDLRGADARKALLIILVMTLHSFTEGVGVGVSFGGGEQLGVFITAAIAVHNIPEGLAISLVLMPRGVNVWRSAGWSIFSSLPQPLMAVPAFLFVSYFTPFLPFGFGFAAGAMIWMIRKELLPEAMRDGGLHPTIWIVIVSGVLMMLFQIWLKG